MAIVMSVALPDFGLSGDELSQIRIGENTYEYLGRTFQLLPDKPDEIPLNEYSGFFGVVSTFIVRLTGADEIMVRHIIIAFTGFMTIVFAGKCARLLFGYPAEIFAIWMLFCSPRFFGASMNNSKDIPFALGMIVSAYYLLRILLTAPILNRKYVTGLFCGLFLAFSIRIGGMFFGLYMAFAWIFLAMRFWKTDRTYIKRVTLSFLLSGLAAFLLSLIFLPHAWGNIFLKSAKAAHRFSNYSLDMTMLYLGRDIPTIHPPWHYLPVWIGITVPVIVVILLIFAIGHIIRKPAFPEVLLLSMGLLPGLFVVANGSAVYDSWRQYYFIYSPIIALAAGAASRLYCSLSHVHTRAAFGTVFAAGLALPVAWSIRNHPLEHVYFNEIVGGIKGAYGRFETDYYGDGLQLASEKLLRHLEQTGAGNDIVIAENTSTQLRYYLQNARPQLQVQHVAYAQRDTFQWHYGVFATRGIDTFRKRSDWPPANMIDSVTADGMLLIAIVKGAGIRP